MLSYKDLNTLQKYCDTLNDPEIRRMLDQLFHEYCQYKQSGSPEDCAQRKEWMEMSYEDIRNRFNDIVQGLRNEVAEIKKEAAADTKPKKRGRPKKNDPSGWDNPPRFDSLDERNAWYK